MIIKTFPSGPFATNAYVLACKKTRHACIIDPAPESAVDLERFIQDENLIVKDIYLTHSHWDHTGDLAKIKKIFDVPVSVHELDAGNVEKPGSDGLPLMMPIEAVAVDSFLHEGDELFLGDLKFKVVHTPGHTPGGVCFYFSGKSVLISGDTLFKQSIGNLSFPTANAEKMWESLSKLEKLPSETRVFPGHGEDTRIGDETWLSKAREIFGT
ncbi:Uncharacterized protein aq_2135 [Chlamydiales bacterium SCGC AG-110-M15]|nr:Uncharacterized protein aq_2135 [Chlamydiales bacterium SCGC AG-110-M15]